MPLLLTKVVQTFP